MKRVLVIGALGMAGHMISQYLKSLNKYHVLTLARKKHDSISIDFKCDLEHPKQLEAIISDSNPDFVINCIGILNKFAENNHDTAILLNSYLPHFLSGLGNMYNFELIHISTDCVFSGKKGGYIESDVKDGVGFYAETKALGEINNNMDLTIRTSIIGPELKNNGIGLFDWFLKQKGYINGYLNAFWSGVTTLELAKAIDNFIDTKIAGLVHLTPSDKISKYNLLCIIKEVFSMNYVDIKAYNNPFVDKSLTNTRNDLDYNVLDYKEMLNELYNWMKKKKDIYKRL
ncbi:hypothetical protein ES705_28933 [subsurface metagenome]